MTEDVVSVLANPPCELRLAPAEPGVSAGSRVLSVASTATGSKKIGKHLVLAKWSDHLQLTSKVPDGPTFGVQPKTLVFVKETGTCAPLASAFTGPYAKYGQVYGYRAFPAGMPPKTLTPATPGRELRLDFSHASFASTRAVVIAAIEAARSALGLQLVWMMRAEKAKQWVIP